MCGICGIYSFDGEPDQEGTVRSMAARMIHRGPDQEGFLFDGPVALGHRRLSIIDLEGGRQPIPDEERRIWVVLNGEIYNYRELRRDLQGGHRFRTDSDTEVLVHLYQDRGLSFVESLNGMFALALWDSDRRTLILARDRLGIKPLYFVEQPGRLLFASEIKALLGSRLVTPEVQEESLYDYLRLKFVPGADTLFRGIRRLDPGSLLLVRPGGTSRKRYWTLPAVQERPRQTGEEIGRIRSLLEDSVRHRLVADVPVGVLLSGGIDSSALVAIQHSTRGAGTKTFSVGFPNFERFDETSFARMVSHRFATDHHELRAEVRDLPDLLFRLTWHLDEPISDPAIFPTYIVCRYARQEVKVVLSGEGADELFAGYNKYWKDRWLTRYQGIPRPFRQAGFGVLSLLRGTSRRRERIRRRTEMPPGIRRHLDWSAMFSAAELEDLSGGQFGRRHEERLQENLQALAGDPDGDPLDASLRLDLGTSLVNSLLMKVDKISMAASLEVRVPYLDHRLVEHAVCLPSTWKIRHGGTKWALKKAIHGLVPRRVLSRPKHGFDVPVSEWLRNGLRDQVQENLRFSTIFRHGPFRNGAVQEILRRHLNRDEDRGEQLWGLMVLGAWHRTFIEASSEAAGMVTP